MPGVVRNSTNGAIQLSPNFFLSEFIESNEAERLGIDNTPNPIIVQSLFEMAKTLEQIRKLLGNGPIIVSSGYRSPALNKAVGGSATSDHMTGRAADFKAPRFGTPLQAAKKIADSSIKFGQLIWEGSWVHISLPDGTNDGQVMTAKFIDGKARYTRGLA
jgi:zinc D-Ala-D-Ala carboxypeptidase